MAKHCVNNNLDVSGALSKAFKAYQSQDILNQHECNIFKQNLKKMFIKYNYELNSNTLNQAKILSISLRVSLYESKN